MLIENILSLKCKHGSSVKCSNMAICSHKSKNKEKSIKQSQIDKIIVWYFDLFHFFFEGRYVFVWSSVRGCCILHYCSLNS